MAHRKEQHDRLRAERLAREATEAAARRRRRTIRIAGASTLAVAVVAALVFLTPQRSTNATPVAAMPETAASVGGTAPDFAVQDVVSGRTLRLADLRGQRTLLFFSEGASCQACLVQAADLQKNAALRRSGIHLVSVTTDSASILRDVAKQYSLRTPLLADETRAMSAAYGMLGLGGMGHANQDGHAFALLDERGRMTWKQAYQQMYVPTKQLLADMKGAI